MPFSLDGREVILPFSLNGRGDSAIQPPWQRRQCHSASMAEWRQCHSASMAEATVPFSLDGREATLPFSLDGREATLPFSLDGREVTFPFSLDGRDELTATKLLTVYYRVPANVTMLKGERGQLVYGQGY